MADTQRSSVRRWAQLALGAAIVMYGIVGFPTPQDTDPNEAAAAAAVAEGAAGAAAAAAAAFDTQWACPGCGYTVDHYHRPPQPPPDPFPPFDWSCCALPDWLQPTVYDDYSVYDPMTGITTPPPDFGTGGTGTGSSSGSGTNGGELCPGNVHGPQCDHLDDLGIDRTLLDGPTYDVVLFDEAERLALAACAVNDPPCNQAAAAQAWADADPTDDLGVSRITQAETMCAAYDGPPGCSDEQEVIAWMCDKKYTANCGVDGSPDFDPYATMSSGESWSFNERPILDRLNGGPCDGCYVPPGGHQHSPNLGDRTPLGPNCDNGLTVIAAHIDSATSDDGCRPPHCDFGRGADGWCAQPTSSDPPTIYVVGSSADEDVGTMRFRVRLSHAVPQTVTVRVDTVDGTATAGSDYTAVRRTVTFAANTTLWFVNVPVRDDTVAENDETFSLAMSSPSPNAGLSTPSAEATIRDNDTAPLLRVQNLNVSCAAHINEVFRVAASWAAPNGGADSYHAQLSDDPRGFLAADDPAVITDMSGSTLLALRGTTSVVDTYWVHVQASRVNGGVGPVTRASAACTALLPSYVAPPAAPECPNNWHEHGFDCVPDHTVPIVCGTSAHQYKVHNIFTPGGHLTRTHPACASVPDVCSTGFHDHAGTCVRTHEDPPLPCRANRRLVWQNTIHGTSEVLACPDPAVDTELLVDTAGKDLTLSFSVDVTSGHVEPTRTFNITATDGTAVNGTHYTMASPVTATFDSATQTYTGSIPTIARQDHGSYPRTFTITVTDAHPLRGHVSVSATATINPPAIERQ